MVIKSCGGDTAKGVSTAGTRSKRLSCFYQTMPFAGSKRLEGDEL